MNLCFGLGGTYGPFRGNKPSFVVLIGVSVFVMGHADLS
jgi:hypothetical protein